MCYTRLVLATCICLLVGLGGCSGWKQPAGEPVVTTAGTKENQRIASENVVKATPQLLEINAGNSGETVVQLAIDDGYHLNANPPTFSYLKATELEIEPVEGISVGPVKYPTALTREFQFADQPLAVYEGQTELKVTLKADQTAPLGERLLVARLRVQACDEQVCYPPGTIDLRIPVKVK